MFAKPKLPALQALMLVPIGGFAFVEDACFDRSTRTFRWSLTPKRLRNQGKVTVEPAGEGVVRHTHIEVEANVPGLGRMMERSAEKRMRDGWQASARFMNERWFAGGATA